MIKEAWIDLETTGTDPLKNGIWQIACITYIDGERQDRFEARMNILTQDIIVPDALKVGGIKPSDLKDFDPPGDIFIYLKNFLGRHVDKYNREDKMFFFGCCAWFDYQFLRSFFYKMGDKYFGSYFFNPPIDVMILAAEALMEERHKMDSFGLKSVACKMEIDFDESKAHDALYDIEITRKIYETLKCRRR